MVWRRVIGVAMARTRIEWTDATWSPMTGCTKVSAGCDNCYAETLHERFHGRGSFATLTLHENRLNQPLRWEKPRRIFVNSMSDVFHADVPAGFLAQIFAVMAARPEHTFQILTKRPARMRAWLDGPAEAAVRAVLHGWGHDRGVRITQSCVWFASKTLHAEVAWPLPNVWLGVSVEDQRSAAVRIPGLLDTPAAVRWISAEPLLGPVDLHNVGQRLGRLAGVDALRGGRSLDWVVVGGESGPRARPMHPQWARQIRDQCSAAGVPFSFKQWGEWSATPPERGSRRQLVVQLDGVAGGAPEPVEPVEAVVMHRLGKRLAGRRLDGFEHDEYPAPHEQDGGL